jgi:hypothetical protein
MDEAKRTETHDGTGDSNKTLDLPIESIAIRRMIEEIRIEQSDVPRSYNRTFNRHNR